MEVDREKFDPAAGELVRRARQRAGLSQVELANRSGVARTVICAIERGHRQPSVSLVSQVLEGCGEGIESRPPSAAELLEIALVKYGRLSRASKSDRLKSRKIYDALTLAESIKRSKQIEATVGFS